MTVTVATLGFPRIGARRELKTALEHYWNGQGSAADLLSAAASLRKAAWERQRALGVDAIPSNDFSFYDHVLDTSAMVGAIPPRFEFSGNRVDLDTYFAMARGRSAETGGNDAGAACSHGGEIETEAGTGVNTGTVAEEMTKWFDTNYHYLVPELEEEQVFRLTSTKCVEEFLEAKALGIITRPVLLGPVTFLLLSKAQGKPFDTLTLLPRLLPIYVDVLRRLAAAGADWVQMDEPALVLDLSETARAAFAPAYAALTQAAPTLRLMLATYFGALEENLPIALSLPVHGLHVDLVRAPAQLADVLAGARADLTLSLGVLDGRNIWRADLNALLAQLAPLAASGRALVLAPSCSLLHVPLDLERETDLDAEIKSWLAFAVQKISELRVLADALNIGPTNVAAGATKNNATGLSEWGPEGVTDGWREHMRAAFEASARAVATRRTSPRIHAQAVQQRAASVTGKMVQRSSPFPERRVQQKAALGLPLFPTTTIGSFPQTADVRKARAAHAKGTLSTEAYQRFLRNEIASAVAWQHEVELDVLVHGEFERNDMVQYFGEQLSGFAFTKHAWVQSYGSRSVRPPIIFGDVARPAPMTVAWWAYAQSLTKRPMKGMLTGPVTLLNWSFVRDDQPRSATCLHLALAVRDEVLDLEKAGAEIIQIDEAALREGLPLRRAERQRYLDWAVSCFQIAASGVADRTQIHTHMCYSEFNDILEAIAAMDADVISIETARSRMELLDAFAKFDYPAEIGPGVYDIHSPRVPETASMTRLLKEAQLYLKAEHIWVNPDCGLKTRTWADVKPSIRNMVAAAREMREAMRKAN
ncbi:5-methyltetrahydropteroyltriglutamate--homocysteine S-methyltransferase [Acetobacter farinalis]|uniref:5-methyltetrahydropteroyltriglutamate--homocysteine methyltransferase n=1 Tax=Acetobacter farinalis TaxID=1260984 RepID=A0ABT3Q9H9_9PROT|nr:5-methyltetrahydropteroyltriglutamate--homocysteine S-methyltransferase [Acetobacter farinalis]MCX2561934.1 5-methyltetrahydropteroyltriglutamate--homocysteine S-methyltransferase [Acetobacter farinalis]NHO30510.1 5-methyltetrahydropteroyltriglutamate--homocysteine S-methyltransferase [Acetobacter farinalis]